MSGRIKLPARVQGTDGIRREVAPADYPSVAGLDPVEAFVNAGILTDTFFEGYAYAFGKTLRETLGRTPKVLVAWDPRDLGGAFTGATAQGIRKAGCTALVGGVAPTPAVPMYVAAGRADAGMMVTASHNPADQNGVKIFLGPTGLKPLPEDDIALTETLDFLNWAEVADAKPVGKKLDVSRPVRALFTDFHTRPENAWLTGGRTALERFVVVVDPARGSYSGLAAEVLSWWGAKVVEVNPDEGDGRVNHLSGVADLEGYSMLPIKECLDGKWSVYPALAKMARLALSRGRPDLGDLILAGAVFDADGDRFFLLLYLPDEEAIAVLSGDECAVLQGRFLSRTYGRVIGGSLFVNTVESDLGVSDAAADLGLNPALKPVGDKWILLEANRRLLEYAGRSAGPSGAKFAEAAAGIAAGEVASARLISDLLKEALPSVASACVGGFPGGAVGFAVGCEETGHAITFGAIQASTGPVPFAAGNGLKSALNTLAAVESLVKSSPAARALRSIARPFEPGYKANRYVYFTRKEKLAESAPFSAELRRVLTTVLKKTLPELKTEARRFPEEPEMVYICARDGEKNALAAFARNSGTEDKSCLYLRALSRYQTEAEKVVQAVYPRFYSALKDRSNRKTLRELEMLGMLAAGYQVRFPPETSSEMETILVEKEGLLAKQGPRLTLTALGSAVAEEIDQNRDEIP